MKEIAAKIGSFFNRTSRYFVFSTLLSFSVMFVLIIANFIMGVRVSLGIYLLFMILFSIGLTSLIALYNINTLFKPVKKSLIKKVDQAEVERARRSRRDKRANKKIS